MVKVLLDKKGEKMVWNSLGVFSLPANVHVCVRACVRDHASASSVGGAGRITQVKVGRLIRSLIMSSQEMIHTIFLFIATNAIRVTVTCTISQL